MINIKNVMSQSASQRSDQDLSNFLQGLFNCHILYHNRLQPQPFSEDGSIQIIYHAFQNIDQVQAVSVPLSLNTNGKSEQTFVQVQDIGEQENNKEDSDYLNYRRNYQTVVKNSRRKEYVSPQKHNKEMSLLINQFLSNMSDQTQNTTINKASANTSVKVQTKNNDKPHPKRDVFDVKVKKVDLNTIQPSKSRERINSKTMNIKQKQKNKSQMHQNSTIITKRVDINEVKSKNTGTNHQKTKDKCKIQVKVKQINPKSVNTSYNSHRQVISIANNLKIQRQKQQNDQSYKLQQKNNGNYSHQYQKKKHQKQSRVKQSSINMAKTSPKIQEKSIKRPLKIQIQIPQSELSSQLIQRQESDEFDELDQQGAVIINQISTTICRLIKKMKKAQRVNN